MNFFYCFIFFALIFNNCLAQFSTDYKKYKEEFPNAHLVRINELKEVEIKLINDELLIEEKIEAESILLSKSAKFASKGELAYSSFSTIENLKASAINFEEGKYLETKVENFINSDKLGTSFYDDIKKVEFVYPGLGEGSKTKLSYVRKIKNPRFLSGHYFGSTFPMHKNAFQIIVDNNIQLEFREFNLDKNIKFSKKTGKKKTTYRWEVQNTEALKIKDDAPNYLKQFPHIIPFIKDYKNKTGTIKVSGSVDNLYSWYFSLVENLNTDEKENNDLKNTVLELIKDKTSDLEKVKAIYYWTQENIKYIAFEYALGGFVPREATDVYHKKYGDCKDNSSILKSMLKIAGLKGNLTWIGTRDIPYTYNELPTPAVDNHMILSYTSEEGETYFLDATGRYIPLEYPTSFIQGKEALISIDKENFKILKVPVISSKKNTVEETINVKLIENGLEGKGKMELNGYPKIDFYNALEQIPTQEKLKDYYTFLLRKGSNRFSIKGFNEINKFNYDAPFVIDYEFDLKNYIQQYEDEYYVNMNLFSDFSNFKTKKDRKQGKDYDYQNYNIMTAILDIPSNLEINFIPEDLDISSELFDCKISYTKPNSNQLKYTLIVEQKFISLSLEQQQNLNKIVKQIEANYKNVVILKEKE